MTKKKKSYKQTLSAYTRASKKKVYMQTLSSHIFEIAREKKSYMQTLLSLVFLYNVVDKQQICQYNQASHQIMMKVREVAKKKWYIHSINVISSFFL